MDANTRNILGLISEMGVRFVVPVYQRPYSWEESQCAQLWDDILACGKSQRDTHFTGSIVTIQDGSLSDQGVTSLQLIDGQQRITTIMLLLVALARHAGAHPEHVHAFSRDEILSGGYLTNHYRTGEDHYKLTLSKGDRLLYQSLIDALDNDVMPELDQTSRIALNLAFFERRVNALDNVDVIWHGLQRLEVVSIALAQGRDNPQAIFESMNATGKDLSNSDLVRNFVLMSYPLDEQRDLYRTYWLPIEQLLAAGERTGTHVDAAFDDFLRAYLTVMYAPTSMAKADVYQTFKRYVLFHGFNENDRMKNLSLRLKRFCRYYVAVTRGEEVDDEQLARAFTRIADLDVPQVTPLLITLYDAFEHHELSRRQFLDLCGVLESYLVRRAVCDCAASELAPFFSSLIARLDAVRTEEGDLTDALLAMLANERDTERRFPGDAEFEHALITRDLHGFAKCRLLLERLDEALRAKGADSGITGGDSDAKGEDRLPRASWTVEHVMPQLALKSDAWRTMLGGNPERTFEQYLNCLGNLTLTSFEFDTQEASFAEKRTRVSRNGLALSADILKADVWTPERIEARTNSLARTAMQLWAMPEVPEGAGSAYLQSERASARREVTFADLFSAGLVEMDDALVSVSLMHPGRATVTSTGKIMLANGEMFDDPTAAYERFLTSLGWTTSDQNGWMYWRRGDGGPLLDDLRAELLR